MADPNMTKEEVRERMLKIFGDSTGPAVDGERWSRLWDAGTFLPFDRGMPNPALDDTLAQRQDLIGPAFTEENGVRRRKRALVPGCGRGYDVLLLASFGYDAYGLEISQSAVDKCREFAREHAQDYPARDKEVGLGNVTFVTGDYFKDDWFRDIRGQPCFELLYDYTFLCALSPSLRPAWAARASALLSHGAPSVLVCLEFPLTKPPATRGPPYGLSEQVYVQHLTHPGEKLPYDVQDNLLVEQIHPNKKAGALQRIARWQPERTHEIGKGNDFVSVWSLG
ncbi:MAG: hypothetical protein M1817_004361 [Caeruleum heppii]|nr:MAG: hypothetical protein M1817_004361 [Caeruleum heppii]